MKYNNRLIIILSSIFLLLFFEGKRLKENMTWGNSPPEVSIQEWMSPYAPEVILKKTKLKSEF